MTINSLKQALHQDVEKLKRLNLDIMPARHYYSQLFLGWFIIYLLFVSIQGVGCFLAIEIGAWGYVSEHEQELADSGKLFDLRFGSSLYETREAQQQRYQKIERKYNEKREHQHLVRVFKMVTGVLFSSLLFTFFLMGKVKSYVIFKHQLLPHLQTGHYLAKKMKQAFIGYFVIFGCFSLIMIPLLEADMTVFAGIPVFIFSAIAISIAINMEASRIGISVLSTAISNYFTQDQKVETAEG